MSISAPQLPAAASQMEPTGNQEVSSDLLADILEPTSGSSRAVLMAPAQVTDEILALVRELVPNGRPESVDICPVADAAIADCFAVVERQVSQKGGETCYGWRICQTPRVCVEAIFHAVWRDPRGSLLDITPLPGTVKRILFVRDPNRTYDGKQIKSVRRAITKHPAIHEFFQACDAEFELLNRGTRVHLHGRVILNPAETAEMDSIQTRKDRAILSVLASLPRPGRNEPCFCGSGLKFKKCHGRSVE